MPRSTQTTPAVAPAASAPVATPRPYDLAAVMAEAKARREAKAEAAEQELLAKYPHILRVVERGERGPKRVVIVCTDPHPRARCDGEREIATQDLFQVRRCASCAEKAVRVARREKAKARAKADRAALRELRAGR